MSANEGDSIESNRRKAPAKPSSGEMTHETPSPEQKAQDQDGPITHPEPNDVLMGRGAPSTDYPGNLNFRELVKQRRNEYVNAKRRKDKQVIAGEIIATVKRRGGRFLERMDTFRKTNKAGETQKITIWQTVDDRKVLLVKVKQLMRDVGPEAQEKRNLRREHRRQKELELFTKQASGADKETTPSSSSVAAPATPAGLPIGYFPQSRAQLSLSSFPGSQESSALQQDSFFRHHMQQQQQQRQSLPASMFAHFPVYPHGQNVFLGPERGVFLRQQVGMAQEGAFLQQQLQHRPQFIMTHPPAGLSLPHPSLLGQGYSYTLQTQQLGGAPPNDVLAAILRRNAEPSPDAGVPKPSPDETKKEMK
eukprot:scaffold6807_cov220-Amphora_coffeaeformis.AAC.24